MQNECLIDKETVGKHTIQISAVWIRCSIFIYAKNLCVIIWNSRFNGMKEKNKNKKTEIILDIIISESSNSICC